MEKAPDILRILLLEDSDLDAELLLRHFSKFHPGVFEVVRAPDRTQFEKKLDENWDAIISDFDVPGYGALGALETLKSYKLDIPLVVVSGQIGEENAVGALRAGAQDFVMKSNLSRLVPALFRSIRDGNQRKQQLALQKAHEQAVKDREQLLAVICHDLKNPLGSIRLTAQLMSSYAKNGDVSAKVVQDNTARIIKSTERIDRLIHDVMDENKIESGHFVIEPVLTQLTDFWNEVKSSFEPLAARKGLKLIFNDPRPSLMVNMDATRIFQVVNNLIGNAIKFSHAGGEIHASIVEEPDRLRMWVRDYGPGIPITDHKHVFSKFYRGKDTGEPGSGLGLWIARQIVKNHGGEIGLEDNEDGGCCFWFSLPWSEKPVGAVAGTLSAGTVNNILLIDDDDDLSEVICTALNEVGFLVTPATNVNEAIALIEGNTKKFKLIMVDYDLPGKNGGDFIRWLHALRNEKSDIPVILMSAHPDVYERAANLGISRSLRKPMKLERLLEAVTECL